MADDTFEDWTRRLRDADTAALDELMAAWHHPLLRYATQLTGDRDAAYDVLQETFIKLWRLRATLDPSRSLKALLYRIVYTLALNQNRMKKRESAALSALASEAPASRSPVSEELDARRLNDAMNEWIAELPPRRQEAFRLSRFEGLSHDEIAQVMDLSAETVTKHIVLALQYLRDRLRQYQLGGLSS
ncbi:MAG: sigma-70 family RNA polymerase sigma factor [Rhodothermales bacterium]